MPAKKEIWDFINSRLQNDYIFLVRPFEKEYNLFYEKLISHWNNNINDDYLKIEDAESLNVQNLYIGLREAIEESSIVIIDISLGLANVFWEYGIAVAAGKPLILLRNSKNNEKLSLESVINDLNNKEIEKKTKDKYKKLIGRNFDIPADIKGLVYNSYDIDKVEVCEQIIKKIYNSVFDHACEFPQINFVTKVQFLKYLKLKRQRGGIVYYRYDEIRDVDLIKDLIQLLDIISDGNNFQNDFSFFILNIKEDFPVDRNLVSDLITLHQNIVITNLELESKILIQLNKKAFFSFNKHHIIYSNNEDNILFLNNLKTVFSKTSIRLESLRIFDHAYGLMNNYGRENISEINDKGFKFDSYSATWIESPEMIIKKIKPYGCKTNIIKVLQEKITEKFDDFATQYIDDVKYILAIWPLDQAGLELVDNNVKKWIINLNGWYKPELNTLDRFFIIPYNKDKIGVNREEKIWYFKDETYKKQLTNFFENEFEYKKCNYKDRLFVIIKHPTIIGHIFKGNSNIIGQNTILFSKEEKEVDNFRGILQCEDKIELKYINDEIIVEGANNFEEPSSFLLNFVYWKLSQNYHDTNSKVQNYLNQIKVLKNLVSTNDVKIDTLVKVPQYMKVEDFINCSLIVDQIQIR
jgi:hypothetical protein